jgi:hypothetical protein
VAGPVRLNIEGRLAAAHPVWLRLREKWRVPQRRDAERSACLARLESPDAVERLQGGREPFPPDARLLVCRWAQQGEPVQEHPALLVLLGAQWPEPLVQKLPLKVLQAAAGQSRGAVAQPVPQRRAALVPEQPA